MASTKLDGPALFTVAVIDKSGTLIAFCSIGEADDSKAMVIDVRPGYGPGVIMPMLETIRNAFNGDLVAATNCGTPVNLNTMEPIQ